MMLSQKSIMFISFHKCATSYFSSYVLKNTVGYEHVDYLSELYKYQENNPIFQSIKPHIEEQNHVYGTVRIQDTDHPRYAFVESLFYNENFSSIKKIYWVRDPRDILVSMYFSFGFTHGLSINEEFRNYQLKERNRISQQSLDEFIIDEAPKIRKKFLRMLELMNSDPNYILLKYEDMINNFENFYSKLTEFIPLDENIKTEIFNNTRPRIQEDNTQHQRSGAVSGYKDKLKPETVKILNTELRSILNRFDYN